MFEWFLNLIGYTGRGLGIEELARRLGVSADSITHLTPSYREFEIKKRSGGVRRITAPAEDLKSLQRRILRRLLTRLRVHNAATGFQPGKSFVTNARQHQARAVVMTLDIKDFFPSISARRIQRYFRAIGWNRKAAGVLTRILTWQGRLPQGAPTSPRLSNLVNYQMDTRLAEWARIHDFTYSRYADDITISLDDEQCDVHGVIGFVIAVLRNNGYEPHLRKKFDVRRRHQRQEVTGLVVNCRADLPRTTRRWLRAVEHRAKRIEEASDISSVLTSDRTRALKRPTLTKAQLDGWRALRQMIDKQRESTKG